MNSNPYLFNPNNIYPTNKINKNCNCEDKYGPKPFNANNVSKPNIYKPN